MKEKKYEAISDLASLFVLMEMFLDSAGSKDKEKVLGLFLGGGAGSWRFARACSFE